MADLVGIPPITKAWAVSALAASVAVQCDIITPFQLFFTWKAVLERGQFWRIITTFIYFGPLSLDFIFHLFFFMRYSRMLEENSYANRRADYVWLLFVSSVILLLLSPILPTALPFLGSSLAFTLVYLWSRRHPHVRLSLFGILVISAPYLPWALVGFSWILSGKWSAVVGDLAGVAAGHIYYFLVEIWPKERRSGGRNLLATPRIVTRMIDGR